ncbi:MAG: hypothetical protein RMJ98_02670 [Myxococcales bacterium]|nr:hypothetical protein [Myxococcales bacterium]
MTLRTLALLLLALPVGCTRGRSVTRDECDRLLNHYTEQLLRTELPGISPSEHQRVMAEVQAAASVYRPFLACTAEVSREQMDCALAAFHPDEIERCLVSVP